MTHTHTHTHTHIYYLLSQHCVSVLTNENFYDFLFSYQIISHVTPSEMNVCVAVVFYMHVYIFLLLRIFMVFYFLHLFMVNLMLHVTPAVFNVYLKLFYFIVNTNL